MSDNVISLKTLPNVHLKSAVITERVGSTILKVKVNLLDYISIRKSKWFDKKDTKSRIRIGAALVEGKKTIEAVTAGRKVLTDDDVVFVSASSPKATSISGDGLYRVFSYTLVINLKRKISNDSSLFLFTSYDLDKMKVQKKMSKKTTKPKLGTKNMMRKIKAKRSPKKLKTNLDLSGALKEVPLFKNGKKLKKIPQFKNSLDGSVWHGLAVYNKGTKQWKGNIRGKKFNPTLARKMVDNDIVIYNMPSGIMNKWDSDLAFSLAHDPGGWPLPDKDKPKNLKRKNRHSKLLKKISKAKNRSFVYELDDQVDTSGRLHKYFILNLCNILLNKSPIGKQIYSIDKELFMEIAKKANISSIKVEKHSYQHSAKRATLKNGKKSLRERKRRQKKISTSTIAYLNLRKSKSKIGFLNRGDLVKKNPYPRINASLEFVDAGLPNELKTLYFIDNTMKKAPSGRYTYSVSMDIEDVFHSYVKGVLKNIIALSKELTLIKNKVVKAKAYNTTEDKISGTFIQKYFNKQNVRMNGRTIGGETINALEASPIVRGIESLDRACLMLGLSPDEIQIDTKVNFATATPQILTSAQKEVQMVIESLTKKYKVKYPTMRGGNKGRNIKTKKLKKIGIISTNFAFKKFFLKKKSGVKYEYFNFDNKLAINKANFDNRSNVEFSKYFKSTVSVPFESPPNIDKGVMNQLLDVKRDAHLYFTPQTIFVGNDLLDTKTISSKVSLKSFNKIRRIRKKSLKQTYKTNLLSKALKSSISIDLITKEREEAKETLPLKATEFLGNASAFVSNTSIITRALSRKKKIERLDKISSAMAFTKKGKIQTIAAFDLNNKKSVFYSGLVSKDIKPEDIPLQVRSLMFNRSQSVRSNYLLNKQDIFKNPKTEEFAYQMYGNIQKVKFIDGFPIANDGTYDMSEPILKDMTSVNYSAIGGHNKLCIMEKYENVGIPKKKENFLVYGGVFLLEDKNVARKKTGGRTSHNSNHHHEWHVDGNGNGYTAEFIHPSDSNVRHRHKIVNWKVQPAKSVCYPNCFKLHGVRGSAPHGHTLSPTKKSHKLRTSKTIANRLANSFNAANSGVVSADKSLWVGDSHKITNVRQIPDTGNKTRGGSSGGGMKDDY